MTLRRHSYHDLHLFHAWASCQIRKIVGMPGTFSPPPRVSDPDMRRGRCVTHVPWCMLGSLTGGFLWCQWRGKRFWHSQVFRQFHVSGKRPMDMVTSSLIGLRLFTTSALTTETETIPDFLTRCKALISRGYLCPSKVDEDMFQSSLTNRVILNAELPLDSLKRAKDSCPTNASWFHLNKKRFIINKQNRSTEHLNKSLNVFHISFPTDTNN